MCKSDGKSGQTPPWICSVLAGIGEVVITICLGFFLAVRKKRQFISVDSGGGEE